MSKVNKPRVRNRFDRIAVQQEPGDEPSMTQQHMKEAVDINNILAKYQRTGVLEHVSKYEAQYIDCPSADYIEALGRIARADEMFADLPSSVREYFANDTANFLAFVQQLPEGRTLADLISPAGKVLPEEDRAAKGLPEASNKAPEADLGSPQGGKGAKQDGATE